MHSNKKCELFPNQQFFWDTLYKYEEDEKEKFKLSEVASGNPSLY